MVAALILAAYLIRPDFIPPCLMVFVLLLKRLSNALYQLATLFSVAVGGVAEELMRRIARGRAYWAAVEKQKAVALAYLRA